MKLKVVLFRAIVVAAVACYLPPKAGAQSVASITGVVTDQSGANLPHVSVTLQNRQTGVTYKTVTNDAGSYTLNQVKPGPDYQIAFAHDGFSTIRIAGVYMNVDSTRIQNARLSVGTLQQTVEVSAANQGVTLDTTDATVGNNFQVQFLNDLPIADRDSPAALFTQQPGVTLNGAVTGARVDQNNVTLDGLDVNDNATGNFGAIRSPAREKAVAANMSSSPGAAPMSSMAHWWNTTGTRTSKPTTGSTIMPGFQGLHWFGTSSEATSAVQS